MVISIPWRSRGDHIGVCESRARVLAFQWRFREQTQLGRTFVHLLDSQSSLAMVCNHSCDPATIRVSRGREMRLFARRGILGTIRTQYTCTVH